MWCARQVAHLALDQAAADAAINAAEAWCDNPCDETQAAAAAAATANSAAARTAANAARAATNAARAAARAAANAADAATNAARAAARAAANTADSAVVDLPALPALLDGLIAEHARLTGHQPATVTAHEWDRVLALVTN